MSVRTPVGGTRISQLFKEAVVESRRLLQSRRLSLSEESDQESIRPAALRGLGRIGKDDLVDHDVP